MCVFKGLTPSVSFSWLKRGGNDRQTDGQRGEGETGQEAIGRRKMEVALWGRIWIRLSSGDPSSSRINALKFFVLTPNGFKETAEAGLWMPGTRAPGLARALCN